MNLIRFRNLYFLLSALVIIPGLISLAIYGLRPAVDFTGGSLLELVISSQSEDEQISSNVISESVGHLYELESVQQTGPQAFVLRGKSISNEVKNQVVSQLQQQFGTVVEQQFATVGPTFGRETLVKMITAMLIVAAIIMFYVWKQFNELKYGVSAIIAMLHDTLVLLGVFSILGVIFKVEVDVLFVTALLTTLSFSVHDTIVVYDRIRELRRKHGRESYSYIVNAATVETLSRSLNNSLTIIIMLLSLVLIGGETIRWFAVALLVGAITGTYSSTFTAAPILLLWDEVTAWRASSRKK